MKTCFSNNLLKCFGLSTYIEEMNVRRNVFYEKKQKMGDPQNLTFSGHSFCFVSYGKIYFVVF